MTNEEKVALWMAPRTEDERAIMEEAHRLVDAVPGVVIWGENLGRPPGELHGVYLNAPTHGWAGLIEFLEIEELRSQLAARFGGGSLSDSEVLP
jgi:hypothetical protein